MKIYFTGYDPKFGPPWGEFLKMVINQNVYIQIKIPCVIALRIILLLLCEKYKLIPSMVLKTFPGRDFSLRDRN